jgi:carboxyl-terminal processing protease
MLNSLGDPYTTYLAPAEINSLEESLKGGDFGGIGVYIEQDKRTGSVFVAPIDGTPASKAGVRFGDRVLAVGDRPVGKMKIDQVSGLIRGPVGTSVALKLLSRGSTVPRYVAITRQQIIVPSVKWEMKGPYDYVRLSDFGSTSYDEVRKAMLAGKAKGAKGYIFDLRNNGGGLLDAAVQISSLFIPDGTIVSTIDRAGDREIKTALHTSIGTAPLVVLVNKYTASASEITAGAVQDYHVGTLMGTKTFGKGVVQSIYNTPDGGALKITTARYLTPHGRDIQHRGIEPDIVVNQTAEAPIIDSPYDKQLAAAIAYLKKNAH